MGRLVGRAGVRARNTIAGLVVGQFEQGAKADAGGAGQQQRANAGHDEEEGGAGLACARAMGRGVRSPGWPMGRMKKRRASLGPQPQAKLPTQPKAEPKAETKAQRRVILVTGTPGTGKSLLINRCKEELGEHGVESVNVSELVKAEALHDGYDAEFDTFVINDRKTRRRLRELLTENAATPLLVECHSCGLFAHRKLRPLVQDAVVLMAGTACLYDRLTERGYSSHKRAENVECEIMEVCAMEAEEVLGAARVRRLASCTAADMDAAVAYVKGLLE